ncbi:transposase [Streptomyces sp. NPDC059832]|uniref:transposase n=1 Tax=Streptomyces sp. NPDC059832 TaxID=3346966 RepID=UPI00365B8FC2
MFEPFARADQRRWGGVYLRGLLLDGGRKSVEPMAGRLFGHHPRRRFGVVTGERRAAKVACVVRAGGRWKRACSAGTSPTAHQYPVAQLERGRRALRRRPPRLPAGPGTRSRPARA